MLFWRNKLNLPLIKQRNLKNNNINILIKLLKKEKIDIKLIYATLDFPVNIIICCLFFKEYPFVSFGFGSGDKTEGAILKSIEEAILVRNTLILLKKYDYAKNIQENKINSFLDHAVYASYNPHIVNWLKELKEENISPINKKITLDYLKKELSKRNVNTYFANITKNIFKNIGFFQSKTVIPAFCQRDMNNKYKFLKNERISIIPEEMGYKSRNNTDPHPFA